MRNIKIISGILVLAILCFTSCEKPDRTYTGPSVAEFVPLTTSSTYTTAFTKTITQAGYVSTVLGITINLVGPQEDHDIKLEYSLVLAKVMDFPSLTYFIDPTDAIEGTHFNFVPARTRGTDGLMLNGVVTIPAHRSSGTIQLNSIASQVSPDVSKRIVIKLRRTDDLEVNPNYQYFIVVITRV